MATATNKHDAPPTVRINGLLSLNRRRGTHCQKVYVTRPLVLLLSAVFSKHFFSQSTSVSTALEALVIICYVNLRFRLHSGSVAATSCLKRYELTVITTRRLSNLIDILAIGVHLRPPHSLPWLRLWSTL